jgi:hypothetical protein
MSSFNSVRLPDGNVVALAEWLHQPKWSTAEWDSAAAPDLRLFNYVRGGNVSSIGLTKRQATDEDTNMVKRRSMNQDESLIVFAITYEIFGISALADSSDQAVTPIPLLSSADLRRLQRDLMFELRIGGLKKPQISVPFVWLHQSIGPTMFVSGDTGATVTHIDAATGGSTNAKNQEQLRLPIYIGGFGEQARPGNSMMFEGHLYNSYGGAIQGLNQDIRIRVYLDGLGKRPA